MKPGSILTQSVVDLVRMNPRSIQALADLGIGPRYLYWSIEASARDLGINTDRVAARLRAVLPDEQFPRLGWSP